MTVSTYPGSVLTVLTFEDADFGCFSGVLSHIDSDRGMAHVMRITRKGDFSGLTTAAPVASVIAERSATIAPDHSLVIAA